MREGHNHPFGLVSRNSSNLVQAGTCVDPVLQTL